MDDNYRPYLLLVDDDEAVTLKILVKILKEDYDIKIVTNGRDALAIAKDLKMPDLILLDVDLPDFSGFEICSILKKCRITKDIPIIFITGNVEPAMELHGLEKGAVDYISKPFYPILVKKRIEQHLATLRYQRSLELFKALYESTSEGIIITDKDSVIQSVNPAFTSITGYEQHEIISKNTNIFKSEKNKPEIHRDLWKQLNETGKWSGEISTRVKNGDTHIHNLNINTIFDIRGEPLKRVGIFHDVTEKKKLEEITWRHANFDVLTNLPNRRFFYEKLENSIKKCKRKNTLMALFFLDLDHFKEVNDTLGHEAGDELLIQAAKRIKTCVREVDVVSRLGGDEFTIIFEDVANVSNLDRIANDICNALSKPFEIMEKTVHISTSIGISICPNDTGEENTLLKKADQAMYQAKRKGRNCFSYCDNF